MLDDLPAGQPWTVPVMSFLVAHPRGRLLFDTGVHCQARVDPIGRMGAERAKRLVVKSKAGEDVVPQLALLGLTARRRRATWPTRTCTSITAAATSSSRARPSWCRRRRWRRRAGPASRRGYNPSPIDFDHPLDYRLVDGEHDVFGDGSVILFPTFGHTPGHQSLRVRAGQGRRTWSAPPTPATRARTWTATCCRASCGTGRPCASRSPRCAACATRPGATVFYGHDPAQWQRHAARARRRRLARDRRARDPARRARPSPKGRAGTTAGSGSPTSTPSACSRSTRTARPRPSSRSPQQPSGLGWLPDGRCSSSRCSTAGCCGWRTASRAEHADLVRARHRATATTWWSTRAAAPTSATSASTATSGEAAADHVPRRASTPTARVTRAADDLVFPNGTVITPDGRTLIVGETMRRSASPRSTSPPTARSRNRRVWAAARRRGFPTASASTPRARSGSPTRAGPSCCACARAARSTAQSRPAPAHAFACMLGGADRRTLFVCTCTGSGPAMADKRDGRIETVRVDVPGAGLP